MIEARLEDQLLAQCDERYIAEDAYYFPPTAVERAYLRVSQTPPSQTAVGLEQAYDVIVDETVLANAATAIVDPDAAYQSLQGYFTFNETIHLKDPARKHPDLYTYSPDHLDPVLVEGNPERILHEEVEQIYAFQFFTPEFCQKLIEEAEHYGQWVVEETVAQVGPIVDVALPDMTLTLDKLPGLTHVYHKMVDLHIVPIINRLWKTFQIQIYDPPYILKYEPTGINSMDLHWDKETVAMIIYLNDDYESEGTYFPRWNYKTGCPKPGSAVIYPGGVSHEHAALPVTNGNKYIFLGAFY